MCMSVTAGGAEVGGGCGVMIQYAAMPLCASSKANMSSRCKKRHENVPQSFLKQKRGFKFFVTATGSS